MSPSDSQRNRKPYYIFASFTSLPSGLAQDEGSPVAGLQSCESVGPTFDAFAGTSGVQRIKAPLL